MPLFTLTTSLFSFRAGEREGRGREPPEEREEKTPLFTVPGNAEKKGRHGKKQGSAAPFSVTNVEAIGKTTSEASEAKIKNITCFFRCYPLSCQEFFWKRVSLCS